ncbi:ABC transporter ATP-binding protein [Streptomyces sp. NPDC057638]|uniref:ABC transporter ATP-binding protein n=1 Tax=Streptomyces sp. NPDC057638 TaxID=3346190 RepID=UPI0036B75AEC
MRQNHSPQTSGPRTRSGHDDGPGVPVVRADTLVIDSAGRRVADGLELTVGAGEAVAITGPPGSGKTALLNCLAGLARPTSGYVEIAGGRVSTMAEDQAALYRLTHIGMVYQSDELIPELSVTENLALPAMFAGHTRARDRAPHLLTLLGLDGLGDRAPVDLSHDQCRRVAIARALVCDPAVVLADNPTGALPEPDADLVTSALVAACRTRGTALVLATEAPATAARLDRTLFLQHGLLTPYQP